MIVSGRVQGVWFRESCRHEAERLDLTGWVRNRPDGAVELEAEGTPAALDTMEAWARRGPPLARVDRFERTALEPEGSERFEVR